MDRFWLLTWTTYGAWLPGDERGFVSAVREESGEQVLHNIPGTEYDAALPGLKRYSRERMNGDPVRLSREQAAVVLGQLQETALYKGWQLSAITIMANHIHLVVGVPGDPDPAELLQAFKSYASRALNRQAGARRRWWTESGSRRILKGPEAVSAAIHYVLSQEYPLEVWQACDAEGPPEPASGRR